MFNFAVITLKDIIKYLIKLIIIVSIIFVIIKILPLFKDSTDKISLSNLNLISCIDSTSGVIKETNKTTNTEIKAYSTDFFKEVLKTQIGAIDDYGEIEDDFGDGGKNHEVIEEQEKIIDEVANADVKQEETAQLAETGLKTEVITPNPIELKYNVEYGNVKIKNETSYDLTDEMLNPDIKIENKNIVIFHTHTCESYTSSEKYQYEPTGNYRTTDLNYSVARVGDELENCLKKYSYNVIHDKTYHDYPAYNGSYTRSLETVQNILQTTPSDIIFDIHRDAIGSRSDYAPSVKIGEDVAAQIMFVIGTDEGGLVHPNWNQNLKFAIKVQEKAEELYPGLFKPIMLTKYRYNQHTGKYANIIEVGATGNTLEQCITSMKYLSKVLDEVMKE